MKVRSEAAQTSMATRRATEGFRRRTRQYVEESDRAQRSKHARIRCRSRSFMNNPGEGCLIGMSAHAICDPGHISPNQISNQMMLA